ncbi:MAG: DUF523 and DUF1722 domain-containing protein [Candidatus Aminicenantaceae bacterium]
MDKPRIVISECINLKPVRYDGGIIKDSFSKSLENHVHFIPVCPEVDIGLGVPREKVVLVKTKKKDYRLSQPETGLDLTQKMIHFSEYFLNQLEKIDGFLLKSKSPSCGVSGTKTYKSMNGTGFLFRGKGIFAMKVMKYFPYFPCEDESRLIDVNIRTHFLTRIFALFQLRNELSDPISLKKMKLFHKKYRALITVYNQTRLKNLDRIIENSQRLPLEKIKNSYENEFHKALLRIPRTKSSSYFFPNVIGRLSKQISLLPKELLIHLSI